MGDGEGAKGFQLLLPKPVGVGLHMMNVMICAHWTPWIVTVVNHLWSSVHAIV